MTAPTWPAHAGVIGGGSGFTVAQQLLKGRLRTPRRM
jgi:hypothetical protein